VSDPTAAPTTPTTTATPAAPAAPATAAPTTTAAPATPPAAPDARKALEEASALRRAEKASKERDAVQRQLDDARKQIEAMSPEKRKALLKTDAWGAILDAFPGMSKADVTKALLATARKPDPAAETAASIEALKAQIAAMQESQAAERAAGHEAAVLAHCTSVAKAGGEKYELIAMELERDPAYYRRALIEYEKAHPTHDAAQALASFEAALLQRASGYAKLAKVRALLGGVSAPDNKRPTESQAGTTSNAGGPRTLTKDLASARATPAEQAPSKLRSRELEAREQRQAAIASFTASRGGKG
jgi:hypothetical protein